MDDLVSINDEAEEVIRKLYNPEYWKFEDTYPLPFFRIEIHSPFHGQRRDDIKNGIIEAIKVKQRLEEEIQWWISHGMDGQYSKTSILSLLDYIKKGDAEKHNNNTEFTGVT